MNLRLYLYAALALVLAAIGVTLYVQHVTIRQLHSNQAAQMQQLALMQRNLDDARRAQAATDAALSGRLAATQARLESRKNTNATIQQVIRTQPAAKSWADTAIPAALLGQLR